MRIYLSGWPTSDLSVLSKILVLNVNIKVRSYWNLKEVHAHCSETRRIYASLYEENTHRIPLSGYFNQINRFFLSFLNYSFDVTVSVLCLRSPLRLPGVTGSHVRTRRIDVSDGCWLVLSRIRWGSGPGLGKKSKREGSGNGTLWEISSIPSRYRRARQEFTASCEYLRFFSS